MRNVKTRWDGHQGVRKTSEPAKHLSENPDHMFEWKCLLKASFNSRKEKILKPFLLLSWDPL